KRKKSTTEIGDDYEAKLLIDLVQSGINANITKTRIRKNGKTLFVGDGGIDLFGKYMNMHYIIQAKFRTDKESCVPPSEVNNFILVLMQQPENIVGFFVSNARFSTRSQNLANNPKVNLILCNDNNLVEKIKETQRLHSDSDSNTICIKDITTDKNTKTEIFGIKFEGKIRIGKLRRIRNSPY
ncbi:3543_t:CDS:1, partial [Scutellospora calospora]